MGVRHHSVGYFQLLVTGWTAGAVKQGEERVVAARRNSDVCKKKNVRCNRKATFHYKGMLQKFFRAGLNEITRLRRFQTAFLSTVSCCSNRHESTFQKTNDTASSGVPRVSRAWGQTQFKRSHPARGMQRKIKETLQSDALLAII